MQMNDIAAGAREVIGTILDWYRNEYPEDYEQLLDEYLEGLPHSSQSAPVVTEELDLDDVKELPKLSYKHLDQDDIVTIQVFAYDSTSTLKELYANKEDYPDFIITITNLSGTTTEAMAVMYIPQRVKNSDNAYAIAYEPRNGEDLFSLVKYDFEADKWTRIFDSATYINTTPKRIEDLPKLICRWESNSITCRSNYMVSEPQDK